MHIEMQRRITQGRCHHFESGCIQNNIDIREIVGIILLTPKESKVKQGYYILQQELSYRKQIARQ